MKRRRSQGGTASSATTPTRTASRSSSGCGRTSRRRTGGARGEGEGARRAFADRSSYLHRLEGYWVELPFQLREADHVSLAVVSGRAAAVAHGGAVAG